MKNYITVTRPDGTKLYLNTNNIIYVTKDPADDSGNKTEIVTANGAFIIKRKLEDVIEIVSTGKGEL